MSENNTKFIPVNLQRVPIAIAGNHFLLFSKTLKAQPIVTEKIDVAEFHDLAGQMQTAMVAKQGFSQTERLEAADKNRDIILSGVAHFMHAHSMMPTDDQEDAKALLNEINSFGVTKVTKVTKAPYGAETMYIKSIIERFNTSPHLERVNKFPTISDSLTMLEEANDEFTAIMNEKADEINLDYESCTKLRQKLIPIYDEITEMIEAHAKVKTAPEFGQVISETNAQIVTYHLD